MKSELLIVSSYDESCGNAYFTKALVDGLSDRVACRAIGLDLRLTQGVDRNTVKYGDQHIKNICNELSKAEAVNIQFEPQLFGIRSKDVIRRMKWLCSVNKRTSITFHNTRIFSPPPPFAFVKLLLKGRLLSAFRLLASNLRERQCAQMIQAVVKVCNEKKLPIIVHTQRAEKDFRHELSVENLHAYPLKFPLVSAKGKDSGLNALAKIKDSLNLNKDIKSVGIFGYISAYKGHEEAICALQYLPDNYHLFVFGRQHPATIKKDGSVDEYLSLLMKLIKQKKLIGRVHFMGEYESVAFAELIAAVDVCWLPYREVGQDGSGIAAICLDNAKRVICSASFAFDENLLLDPKPNMRRFDIGNYIQLADVTLMAMAESELLEEDLSLKSYEGQIELYMSVSGF